MVKKSELQPSEYAEYYAKYIGQVHETEDLRAALDRSLTELLDYLEAIPLEQQHFSYGEGKWTITQSLQHIIDCERIFAYRALRFARADRTALPGFDQDEFAAASGPRSRTLISLIEELKAVRESTRHLFASFFDADLRRQGAMSGHVHSVRAIGFIICGHALHHAELYRVRYVWA